jgi:hypothetical protein
MFFLPFAVAMTYGFIQRLLVLRRVGYASGLEIYSSCAFAFVIAAFLGITFIPVSLQAAMDWREEVWPEIRPVTGASSRDGVDA